jgi:2'-5' RNA ligase
MLPPRPLAAPQDVAIRHICQDVSETPGFEIVLGEVRVFEPTSVIYLSIDRGWKELHAIHNALNTKELFYAEPFEYHPHITLAQKFDPAELPEKLEIARRRWAEFPYSHTFPVDRLTFVQATENCKWIDLAECPLSTQPVRR